MNIVLLTTETAHHAYFARELRDRAGLRGVITERRQATPRFETAHPFEQRRDEYEREVLAGGRSARCTDLAPTHEHASVNDEDALASLRALEPELVFVFGTGLISDEVRRCASIACLNLHGGNPEYYRGLDTHLWAIYHDDFSNVVTTLHHVDGDFDTGAIVFQEALRLERSTELHEVRAINTRACVNLALLAVHAASSLGTLPSRPQLQRGRYYSFMPAALKDQCVLKLRRHLERQ